MTAAIVLSTAIPTSTAQLANPTPTSTTTPTNETPPASFTSTETTGYIYNLDTSDPSYCALGNRPSADDERAATWTSVCFPTPTVIPVSPLSLAYLNPESAVRAAMQELGINPNAANPIIQRTYDAALAMTKGYHLVTADLGQFNVDTTGFFEWVKQILELQNQVGSPPERQAMVDLASEQAYIAIYEPETDIGIQIRLLELGIHPLLPGSGPEVYWEYLIKPATALAGRNLEVERFGFNQIVTAYQDAVFLGEALPLGFGAYLAENGYTPRQQH